jgi:hypothetical protein
MVGTRYMTRYNPAYCNVFWGSHGCDKKAGHREKGDLVHQCGGIYEDDELCTQMTEVDRWSGKDSAAKVRYYMGDGVWTTWALGEWFT